MRTILYTLTLLLAGFAVQAQKEFPLQWKGAFPVSVEWRLLNDDRTLALGGDLSEIAMLDAVSGKVLWQFTFKEKFKEKKAKDWDWDKAKGVIYITFKGDKKNEEVTHYIDERTAAVISKEQYSLIQVKTVHTKWHRKGELVVGEGENSTTVALDYEKKRVVSSMGKGTRARLSVKASGANHWTTDIDAQYIRTLCTNAIPAAAVDFGGDFLRLMYAQEKVFVIYEGLSVLDLKTGKLLWQIDLDNAEFDFGVFKSTQTLGRAGYPLVTGDAVYVADLSKGQYRIKKYELESGKLLWQSEPFDKDDVVPDLQVSGNVLLAQFGGLLNMQTYIPGTSGRPDVCKSEYKFAGDPGVRAYDAATGKLLWQTNKMKELNDKFSDAITNIISENGIAYVASDKNFYAFDATSGKPKYTVAISKLKIDKPRIIFKLNANTIILQCEEGLASINMSDGKVNYATNTDKCLGIFYEGDAFFVWTGKSPEERNEFIRLDLNDGKILGKMEDTAYPFFTPDGEEFIKFNGEKIMRYKTKS